MNAADLRGLMETWARLMAENRDWLIELDSVVGDSDLGLTMSDGHGLGGSFHHGNANGKRADECRKSAEECRRTKC